MANGILQCVEKGEPGECYILSNQYLKVKEILDALHVITGKKKIKTYLPLWFVKLTAPMAELYYKLLKKPPLFTAYSIYTLNTHAVFSHEKARKELGYIPRDFNETLEDMVNWLKDVGRI